MAALTFYMTNALASGSSHQNMSETSPGADATATPGWTVAKTASANYSPLKGNTKQAAGTFAATVLPAAPLGTSDAMRSDVTYKGDFASGNWAFTPTFISLVTGGGTGKCRIRVYSSVNVDGSSSTEITTAAQETASLALNTSAFNGSITWSAPAFSLADEYLFVQMAWDITGQASSSSADLLCRVGSSSMRFTTTVFTPLVAIDDGVGRTPLAVSGFRVFFAGFPIMRPQEWGSDGAAPAFYLPPVSTSTAQGNVPVMLDTHAPSVTTATGQANAPVLLDSHQPAVATATGQANVPVVLATYAPPVTTATGAANTPVALVMFAPPVVTATAAAVAPFLETTQDPPQEPFTMGMGVIGATIPGSMAILQPQPAGQDAPAAATYLAPVAAATAASALPALLDTHAPPVATASASAAVPVMLATYQPAVTTATAQANTTVVLATLAPSVTTATAAANPPVMLDTHQPPIAAATGQANTTTLLETYAVPVTTATGNAVAPVMLVTYDVAVAAATAFAPVPAMAIPSAEFEYPLTLIGGIPRIPGSMAILQSQPPGADPLSVTVYAAPIAVATAASPVPAELVTYQPPIGAAAGQANTPTLLETYLQVIATAAAQANTPTVLSTWVGTVATATGSSPTPAVFVTFDQIPAAAATAGAYAPTFVITQDEYERPLVFLTGIPRIPGSMAFLKPQDWGDPGSTANYLVPVSTASANAIVPALLATYLSVVATATASAAAPALTGTLIASSATATAGAITPSLLAAFVQPVATATASSPAPLIRVSFAAPVATAIAAALVPLISGLTFGGTSTTRTHATGVSGLAVIAGVTGRSRGTGVTGTTLGSLLGSRTHTTGSDGSTDAA